jgi:hypothetical protein
MSRILRTFETQLYRLWHTTHNVQQKKLYKFCGVLANIKYILPPSYGSINEKAHTKNVDTVKMLFRSLEHFHFPHTSVCISPALTPAFLHGLTTWDEKKGLCNILCRFLWCSFVSLYYFWIILLPMKVIQSAVIRKWIISLILLASLRKLIVNKNSTCVNNIQWLSDAVTNTSIINHISSS